jgi:hypothetical protein
MLVLAALVASLLTPTFAHAAPRSGDGFGQGGFVYGALPFVSIPVGDDGWRDGTDVGVQWGAGGGYMFEPVPHFMLTVGGAFEHTWVNFEDFDHDDIRGNIVRFLPELRIGGGTSRIFGYGYAQPGLAIVVLAWDYGPFEGDDSEAGFNLGIGGGVQGAVWRSLMIGGEMGVDLVLRG